MKTDKCNCPRCKSKNIILEGVFMKDWSKTSQLPKLEFLGYCIDCDSNFIVRAVGAVKEVVRDKKS